MKGHLIVAKELMDAGEYKQAEPHIGHPVEELYSDVEEGLKERKIDDFKADLNQLSDLSKSAPESPEMEEQYDAAVAQIDDALAAISEGDRSAEVVSKVILGMLRTAAEEYEAAIDGDKIVEAVEYQDSRGFVLYAEELFGTISDEVEESDREEIQAAFDELKEAWPSAIPPEEPILEPSAVFSLVSAIELLLG